MAQQNTQKYYKATELAKKSNNRSEIARIIKHPNRTVQEWLSNEKTPRAVRAIKELKRNRLLPLKINENSKAFNLFLDIFSFIYGDGSLKKDLSGIDLFEQEKNLLKLKKRIESLFSFHTKIEKRESSNIIRKEIKGIIHERRVGGVSYALRIHSAQLAKLMFLAGAPKGDKVSQAISAPKWIMTAPKSVKRRFLGVLFGNELQCPRIRATNAFSSSQFGMHKIESKEQDLRFFLEQLRTLLTELGISTSPVVMDNSYRAIRKDESISRKWYFSIDSHSPNVVRLFKEIPFRCAEEKQQRFASMVEQFLQNAQHLKKEWEIYDQVMQLHDSGLGRRTIFKRLQLPQNYFYKINAWVHYGNKPLHYDYRKAITLPENTPQE